MVQVECEKCGRFDCNCYAGTTFVIASSSYLPDTPKDIRDLENEIISLRRELASTKAELFRLRNQKHSRR